MSGYNKRYNIVLPNGQQETWDQDMILKKGNALFTKHPDASVTETEDFDESRDYSPESTFDISLADGRTETWNSDQWKQKGKALREKFPDAQVSVNSPYTQDSHNQALSANSDEEAMRMMAGGLQAQQRANQGIVDRMNEKGAPTNKEIENFAQFGGFNALKSGINAEAQQETARTVTPEGDINQQEMDEIAVEKALRDYRYNIARRDRLEALLKEKKKERRNTYDEQNSALTQEINAIRDEIDVLDKSIDDAERNKTLTEKRQNEYFDIYMSHSDGLDHIQEQLGDDTRKGSFTERWTELAAMGTLANRPGMTQQAIVDYVTSTPEAYDETNYAMAREFYTEADDLLISPIHTPGNGVSETIGSFGREIKGRVTDPETYAPGFKKFYSAVLRNIMEKLMDASVNLNETDIEATDLRSILTDSEATLWEAYMAKNNAEALRQGDKARGSQGAGIALDMIQFMAEIGLSNNVQGAAGRKVEAWMLKGLKRQLEKMAERGASRFLQTTTMYGGKYAANLATRMGQVGLAVTFAPGTREMMYDKLLETNEDGTLKYESRAGAYGSAWLDNYKEWFTETSGEMYGRIFKRAMDITGADKFLKKYVTSNIPDWFKGVTSTTNDALEFLGFHGTIGEIAEEVEGALIDRIAGDRQAWEQFWKGDNLLEMIIGFAPMSLLGLGGNMYQSYHDNRITDAERAFRNAHSENGWSDHGWKIWFDNARAEARKNPTIQGVADIIRNFENEYMANLINDGGSELTDEQKIQHLDAAQAMGKALLEDLAYESAQRAMLENEKQALRYNIYRQVNPEENTDIKFWETDENGNETVTTGVIYDKLTRKNNLVFLAKSGDSYLVIQPGKKGAPEFMPADQIKNINTYTMDQYLEGMVRGAKDYQKRTAERAANQSFFSNLDKAFKGGMPMTFSIDGTNRQAMFDRWENGQVVVEFSEPVTLNGQTGTEITISPQEAGRALQEQVTLQEDAREKQARRIAKGLAKKNYLNEKFQGRGVTVDGKTYGFRKIFENPYDENGTEMVNVIATDENGFPLRLAVSVNDLETQAPSEFTPAMDMNDGTSDTNANLPMKTMADGTQVVDEKALLESDMEAWARYHDSVMNDGGADTWQYLKVYGTALEIQRETLTQGLNAEQDFDKRNEIRQQIDAINGKLAKTNEILAKYIARSIADLNTTGVGVVIADASNIEQKMKEAGASLNAIGQVNSALDAGIYVEGFFDPTSATVFMLVESTEDFNDARSTFLHEQQHFITRANDFNLQLIQQYRDKYLNGITDPQAIIQGEMLIRERLINALHKLGGGSLYDKKSIEAIADEVISYAREVMFASAEDTETALRLKGVDDEEIINFVKSIENETGRIEEGVSNSGRSSLGSEGDGVADSGDEQTQGAGSSEVGEQGSGSPEGSEEVTPSEELTNLGLANNGDQVSFSARYSPTPGEAEVMVRDIMAEIGVPEDVARAWVASETSLAAIILDEENSAYLNYEGDDRYEAIKKDADYPQGTVDFNNICRKRLPFTNMYQRLQKAFPNTIITGEDLANIRQVMKDRGLLVACGLCYVEDRRQLLGEIAKDFIECYRDGFESYGKRGGETKAKRAVTLREMVGEDRKDDLSIYDLLTLDGSMALYKEHRNIYDAFNLFNAYRGQQAGNLFQGYAEYKRDILKWDKEKVARVNSLGGLRVFSYSDFEAHHLIDLVQIIQDAARKGVMIQGYTKVPAFARAVANTNLKLNRSLIPLGDLGYHVEEDGRKVLDYDPVEGIDINDPDFLPSNENVGNILIGINDTQIGLAMLDPFVDYIIPYHSNQKKILRKLKQTGAWTNYRDYQVEKDVKTGTNAGHINIYTDVLNVAEKNGTPITNEREFVDFFLKVCKEKGLIPRFSQFLNIDENGDFAYRKGYYKLLLDFKLFDENGNILPQKPVVANFDDEFNKSILDKYVAEVKAESSEELDAAYNEVVDKLGLNDRTPDISFKMTDAVRDEMAQIEALARLDGTYLKAPNGADTKLSPEQWALVRTNNFKAWFGDWQNDHENASKVVDVNGEPKVVYHGTTSFGFAEFDKKKVDDKRSFFFTDRIDVAQTYSAASDVREITGEPISEDEAYDKSQEVLRDAANDVYRQLPYTFDYGYLHETLFDWWAKIVDGETTSEMMWEELYEWFTDAIHDHYDWMDDVDQNDPDYDPSTAFADWENSEAGIKVLMIAEEAIARVNEAVEVRMGNTGNYATFVNLRNPLHIDAEGRLWRHVPLNGKEVKTRVVAQFAEENGYDGVMIDNLIDSGDKSGYRGASNVTIAFSPNQIKSATENNGEFSKENNDIRFKAAWHGSGASFKRFNDKYIGTGEGHQVHGWGHYVAFTESTGKMYAYAIGGKNAEYVGEVPEFESRYSKNRFEELLQSMLQSIYQNDKSFKEARDSMVETLTYFKKTYGTDGELIPFFKNMKRGDIRITQPNRNFYELTIPDDKGYNYIDEQGKPKKKQMEMIASALSDKNTCDMLRDLATSEDGTVTPIEGYSESGWEKVMSGTMTFDDSQKAEIFQRYFKEFSSDKTGKGLYAFLGRFVDHDETNEEEMISKFLMGAGFTGIKYNGRMDGEAAVIFNPKDIKIDNHISFKASIQQTFTSRNTSLPQIAAAFKKIDWKEGTTNLDLGGGKFDEATFYLQMKGVENLVFDPFNRDAEHNRKIAERVKEGGVDTVTCNNVLNVIDTKGARDNVILQASKAIKPGGVVYFSFYDGNKTGVGRQTGKDQWQESRKIDSYIPEVEKHFAKVEKKKGMLIATEPIPSDQESVWMFDDSFDGVNQISFKAKRNIVEKNSRSFKVEGTTDVTERDKKYGVGKRMAGGVYFHKNYASDILPEGLLEKAEALLPEGFNYNTLYYEEKKPAMVRFDEAPDFDSAREPKVGDFYKVNTETGEVTKGHSDQIWHHKWEWVKDDYTGFDVQESYDWSKQWKSGFEAQPKGIGSRRVWDERLREAGLPIDDNSEANQGVSFKISKEQRGFNAILYTKILNKDFSDVTLQLIKDYINQARNGKFNLSQRLPEEVQREVLGEQQEILAVDCLFSRVAESAVQKTNRTRREGQHQIELKKKELLKAWAIASGNWHTDITEFADGEAIDHGTDSDVFFGKDGVSVIKYSKGKPFKKRWRPDIDNVPMFNYFFPSTKYEILGYGEIDGQFATILRQPAVLFADDPILSNEERDAFMAEYGFYPMNNETAYTNGEIIISDVWKKNIVRDIFDEKRVIDADFKFHTPASGGKYKIPEPENDFAGFEAQFDYTQEPVVMGDRNGISFKISDKRKQTMAAQIHNKLTSMTDEQVQETIAEIERLGEEAKKGGDSKMEQTLVDWVCRGLIILPQDRDRAIVAYNYAKRFGTNTSAITNLTDYIEKTSTKVAEKEADKKPLNPDEEPLFTNRTVVSDTHGIVTYEVPDSKEGQMAVRKFVDSHFGKSANPWCLITRFDDGDALTQAWSYWKTYSNAGRKIAFQNGKLIAFMSSSTKTEEWWDRLDRSHRNIPIMVKFTTEDGLRVTAQTKISYSDADMLEYDGTYSVVSGGVEESYDASGNIVDTRYSQERDGKRESVTISYTRMGSRLSNPIEQVRRDGITSAAEVKRISGGVVKRLSDNGEIMTFRFDYANGRVDNVVFEDGVQLFYPSSGDGYVFNTKGESMSQEQKDMYIAEAEKYKDIKPYASKTRTLRYNEGDIVVNFDENGKLKNAEYYLDATDVNSKKFTITDATDLFDIPGAYIIRTPEGTMMMVDAKDGSFMQGNRNGYESIKDQVVRIAAAVTRGLEYKPRIADEKHSMKVNDPSVIKDAIADVNENSLTPEKKTKRAIDFLKPLMDRYENLKKIFAVAPEGAKTVMTHSDKWQLVHDAWAYYTSSTFDVDRDIEYTAKLKEALGDDHLYSISEIRFTIYKDAELVEEDPALVEMIALDDYLDPYDLFDRAEGHAEVLNWIKEITDTTGDEDLYRRAEAMLLPAEEDDQEVHEQFCNMIQQRINELEKQIENETEMTMSAEALSLPNGLSPFENDAVDVLLQFVDAHDGNHGNMADVFDRLAEMYPEEEISLAAYDRNTDRNNGLDLVFPEKFLNKIIANTNLPEDVRCLADMVAEYSWSDIDNPMGAAVDEASNHLTRYPHLASDEISSEFREAADRYAELSAQYEADPSNEEVENQMWDAESNAFETFENFVKSLSDRVRNEFNQQTPAVQQTETPAVADEVLPAGVTRDIDGNLKWEGVSKKRSRLRQFFAEIVYLPECATLTDQQKASMLRDIAEEFNSRGLRRLAEDYGNESGEAYIGTGVSLDMPIVRSLAKTGDDNFTQGCKIIDVLHDVNMGDLTLGDLSEYIRQMETDRASQVADEMDEQINALLDANDNAVATDAENRCVEIASAYADELIRSMLPENFGKEQPAQQTSAPSGNYSGIYKGETRIQWTDNDMLNDIRNVYFDWDRERISDKELFDELGRIQKEYGTKFPSDVLDSFYYDPEDGDVSLDNWYDGAAGRGITSIEIYLDREMHNLDLDIYDVRRKFLEAVALLEENDLDGEAIERRIRMLRTLNDPDAETLQNLITANDENWDDGNLNELRDFLEGKYRSFGEQIDQMNEEAKTVALMASATNNANLDALRKSTSQILGRIETGRKKLRDARLDQILDEYKDNAGKPEVYADKVAKHLADIESKPWGEASVSFKAKDTYGDRAVDNWAKEVFRPLERLESASASVDTAIELAKWVERVRYEARRADWDARYAEVAEDLHDTALEIAKAKGYPEGHADNIKSGEKDSGFISDVFRKYNSSEYNAELFDKVVKVADILGVRYKFLKTDNFVEGISRAGLITYSTPLFNSDIEPDQRKADTILHEMIHGVTTYAMHIVDIYQSSYQNENLYNLLNEKVIDAVDNLNKIFKELSADPEFHKHYGAKNAREMVAELSRADFREYLDKKSVWVRIKEAIKQIVDGLLSIVGMSYKNENTNGLDAVRNALDDILDYASPGVFSVVTNSALKKKGFPKIGTTFEFDGTLPQIHRKDDAGMGEGNEGGSEDRQAERQGISFKASARAELTRKGLRGVMTPEALDLCAMNILGRLSGDIRSDITDAAMDNGGSFTDALIERFAKMADASNLTPEDVSALNIAKEEIRKALDNETIEVNDVLWAMYNDVHASDPLMWQRKRNQRIKRELGKAGSVAADMTLKDYLDAAEKAKDDIIAQYQAMRAVAVHLTSIMEAMSERKAFDRAMVGELVNLASDVLTSHLIDNATNGEIKRLLGVIRRATGMKNIQARTAELYDLILSNTMKNLNNAYEKVMARKAVKVTSKKVKEQGSLDLQGQYMMDAYREGIEMTSVDEDGNVAVSQALLDKINDVLDKMYNEQDKEKANLYEMQFLGLSLAKRYITSMTSSEAKEKAVKEMVADADEKLAAGEMTKAEHKQFIKSAEELRRQILTERVENFTPLVQDLIDYANASHTFALDFLERDKQRINDIRHDANSDLEGTSAKTGKTEPTRLQSFTNSGIYQFFSRSLATFDTMLKAIGRKSANGEGFLWNRFMRGWIDATGNEYLYLKDAYKALDDKMSEVFGRKMKWSDIYDIEKTLPMLEITFKDANEVTKYTVPQGNALYIILANDMPDGAMKLRKMGISEEDVQKLRDNLDPRILALGEWMVKEFLPSRRAAYNDVHERMFGASMSRIANYFPLVVNKRDVRKNVDVATADAEEQTPSIITNAIMQRTVNALPLDITRADAFSVIIDNVQKMEHWRAFAEWNRDLSDLLSYNRFRNQLSNMTSVFGSKDNFFSDFRDVAMIAAGSYRPKTSKTDKRAMSLAKNVTAAKISLRVYTALKQFLSFPAYFAETNPLYLAESLATAPKSWNWAMENLPVFEKRWKSRQAGDHILSESEDWKSKVVELSARIGMTPNAFVDAMTVSIGAYAIYRTRLNGYLKDGFDQETAEKRAKQDAVILYNETQQSSEDAFMSALQKDRSWLTATLTAFRNSSMGYGRMLLNSVIDLSKRAAHGNRRDTIAFMTKQFEADGLEPRLASRAAERAYRNQGFRDVLRIATFGYMMQFAWNLGSSLMYLLFGDDDDEKNAMVAEASKHALVGGWAEGLPFGADISEILNMLTKGEKLGDHDFSALPFTSDIASLISKTDNQDWWSAANDLTNIVAQMVSGVNPQTIEDIALAIYDAANGDLGLAKEIGFAIMRILQVPQSQVDKLFIDEVQMTAAEARDLSIPELAERYARYKTFRKAGPYAFGYSDEEEKKYEDSFIKRFTNDTKERILNEGDNKQYLERVEAAKEQKKRVDELRKMDSEEADKELMSILSSEEYGRNTALLEKDKNIQKLIDDAWKQEKSSDVMAKIMEANNEKLLANELFDEESPEALAEVRYRQYTDGFLTEMYKLDKKYKEKAIEENPEYKAQVDAFEERLPELKEKYESEVKPRIEELEARLVDLPADSPARNMLKKQINLLKGRDPEKKRPKAPKAMMPESYMPEDIFNSPEYQTYLKYRDLGTMSGGKFRFKSVADMDKTLKEKSWNWEGKADLARQRRDKLIELTQGIYNSLND